ncbi:transferase hexapeptide repeat protein [Methanococcus vannielii SB]|uniref:Transferase hexapeptide repeat protein n=1 Tax=Methanococcus vannielii (strain ATCC 35089 / DSM 1224 / JCM 13029 / OCM 148 / SB) TaxID=406327 RepID=A6UNP4_METVS|nr:acyltransferase [Methanococcus vannielii]ABR54116.1 transferase hexapeptide repeat protein [Methanococcus vannielii SB]
MSIQIHETAIVETDDIGENTKIWHFVHVRNNSIIGKNCNIGKGVYVDSNVKIGNNVKIQNNVSIYNGVLVEDDVFLGPHMVFTNDFYPRAFNNNWKITNTLVKKGASIGANSTIICGITIGSYSMVGSGSVVTKSVPDYGLVYGNPAKLKGFVCSCGKKLTELIEKNEKSIIYKCNDCEKKIEIIINNYDI